MRLWLVVVWLACRPMKLLLTSAGLINGALIASVRDLAGEPLRSLRIAVVPTAANVIEGDKGWLINDFVAFQRAGFAQVDIVDISALDETVWEPRLRHADVVAVTGGDTTHLLRWMRRSGLADMLEDLLSHRVYVGISAGSMVVGPHLALSQSAKPEASDGLGLGLVDFLVQPHLNSPFFPLAEESELGRRAHDVGERIYGLGDGTAVMVDGDAVTVVGEGRHVVLPGHQRTH